MKKGNQSRLKVAKSSQCKNQCICHIAITSYPIPNYYFFIHPSIQLSPHWLIGPRILPNSVPFSVNRYSTRMGRSTMT